MRRATVIVLSLIVLVMGYTMYIPLPSEFKSPWRGRLVASFLTIIKTMAVLMESITTKPMAQYLSEWSNLPTKTVYQYYPELEVGDKLLNGVPVRVYRRKAIPGLIPAVMLFHGGGFVMGSINTHDGVSVRLALKTNMTIIAVNYRKSPKHPYPIPHDDCVQATKYVLKHGKEMGVDSSKVGVAGDSAGGNLAATVALRLGSEVPSDIPPLRLQVLMVPTVQAMTFNTDSYRRMTSVVLSQEWMAMFWASYLGVPYNSSTLTAMLNDHHVSTDVQKSIHGSYVDKGQTIKVKDKYDVVLAEKLDKLVTNPFVSPLLAGDKLLKKTPPALVMVAEYDQLKDEGIKYAERLKAVGVRTNLQLIKGQTHFVLPLLSLPPSVMDNNDYEEIIDETVSYIVKEFSKQQ